MLDFLFCWFPNQLPVFLIGFAVYYALRNSAVTQFFTDPKRPLLLMAMSLFGLLGLTRMHSELVPIHICYALMLAVFIVSVATKPFVLLVNPITCGIGVLSFSCYITHFAVLELTEHFIRRDYFVFLPARTASLCQFSVVWIATLLLTVAASALTYFFIEKPGIKLGSALIRSYEGERTPKACLQYNRSSVRS